MRRQPDFSTVPRREPLRPGRGTWLVAAAALAVVVSGVAAHRARTEARDASARVAEARRQLQEQEARLRAAAPVAGGATPAASDAPPRRIVGAIGAVLPADARIAQLSIDYARGVLVEMQVDARRAAAWDRLLEGLERSPDFADVEPGPEDRAAEVRTTLRARWAGGPR